MERQPGASWLLKKDQESQRERGQEDQRGQAKRTRERADLVISDF